MPVIVGSPRSGTTLLRLMLDAHPALALPPETGFFLLEPEPSREGEAPAAAFARRLISYPPDASAWEDFGLSANVFIQKAGELSPFTPADGFRLFYRLYAQRMGKPRWGDKTPSYGRHLKHIAALLPETRFIHLIRDGRDAAVSLRRQWFSPGDSMATQARFWRDNVDITRQQGTACPHYLEVRYEDLVTDPAAVLRRICLFIELPFDDRMLSHHLQAASRVREHQGRQNPDGSPRLSAETRRQQQSSSLKPPDVSKIGSWRSILTEEERTVFLAEAGPLLAKLGYPMT